MYDIVFISYNEPTADDNFRNLKSRFPSYDKLIYPKFFKVTTQSELDSVISQLNHLEYHEILDTE